MKKVIAKLTGEQLERANTLKANEEAILQSIDLLTDKLGTAKKQTKLFFDTFVPRGKEGIISINTITGEVTIDKKGKEK